MQIVEEENLHAFQEAREELRITARDQNQRIQEDKAHYNKSRQKRTQYRKGDLVAIKRAQFSSGLKIQQKYFPPYCHTVI